MGVSRSRAKLTGIENVHFVVVTQIHPPIASMRLARQLSPKCPHVDGVRNNLRSNMVSCVCVSARNSNDC